MPLQTHSNPYHEQDLHADIAKKIAKCLGEGATRENINQVFLEKNKTIFMSGLQSLYRYRGSSEIKRIFEQDKYALFPQIYLSSPDFFNDPYDSRSPNTIKTSQFFRKYIVNKLIQHHNSEYVSTDLHIAYENEMHQLSLTEPWEDWLHNLTSVEEKYCPNYSAEREKTVEYINNKAIEEHKKWQINFGRQMGIACFTETANSLLMWSHYAENHTGICLEYSISDFTEMNNFDNKTFAPLDLLFPVIYNDNTRYLYQQWNKFRDNIPLSQTEINCLEYLTGLTKAEVWKDEKEWRLFYPYQRKVPTTDERLLPLYPSKIIMGTKIDPEIEMRLTRVAKKQQLHLSKMNLRDDKYELTEEEII